jgi:hypothetical protein
MDPTLLRQALSTFLGNEQFRKLVAQCRRAGRLRFWQEEELARFAQARPDLRFSPDDLRLALRVCEVHGRELLPDTVEVIHGNVDHMAEYNQASARSFPNAKTGPLYTEGAPSRDSAVWYCSECRQAQADWTTRQRRRGPHPNVNPTRRVMLDEYGAEFGLAALTDWRLDRWKALRAEVEAELAVGGELWEYETEGFRALAGESGLAVIRDEVVVRFWQLMRS